MWNLDFVMVLHYRRATVLTFNYDLLIERALDALVLRDEVNDRSLEYNVSWVSALDELPPWPPNPGRYSNTAGNRTLELLKLHGSLNWFWVPGDETGVTLNHWDLDVSNSDRSRFLPGREPFIVPPVSTKSAFLRNPVVMEIWQCAARLLRSASRVYLVGYSMPLTDLHAGGMFADALRSSQAPLTIMNPCPADVENSVGRILEIAPITRTEGAETFAPSYINDHAHDLADQIRVAAPLLLAEIGVAVRSTQGLCAIENVYRGTNTVLIDVSEASPHAFNRSGHPRKPFRELGEAINKGDRLEVRWPDGRRSVVLGLDRMATQTGQFTTWQLLIPGHAKR